MEIEINRNISLLARVKMQVPVLLPVLRRLRVELGRVRANEKARSALRDWSRKLHLEIGASSGGGQREKCAAVQAGGASAHR